MYFCRAPASDRSLPRGLTRSQRRTDRFGELQSSAPMGRKGYPHSTNTCRQSTGWRRATSRHNPEPRSGSLSSRELKHTRNFIQEMQPPRRDVTSHSLWELPALGLVFHVLHLEKRSGFCTVQQPSDTAGHMGVVFNICQPECCLAPQKIPQGSKKKAGAAPTQQESPGTPRKQPELQSQDQAAAMSLTTPYIRQPLISFGQFGYGTADPSPSSPRLVLLRSDVPHCPLSCRPGQDPPPLPPGPSAPRRDSPAVGQVERYAGLNVRPEAQVPQDTQADVQDGDNGHPHIEDDWELLGVLHLVFQR